MPMEHCSYCRYPLHNSIHIPLILTLTYLLHRASTVYLQLLIISPSWCVSYPVPWGKMNCQLHKLQNYCLRILLGFLECQKSLLIIVIPGLLLMFGVSYGIFLALKPVLPLHFTLRVMGKVNTPTIHLNKSYMCTFITNLCQLLKCTTIQRIWNLQNNYPERWLFTIFHAVWAGTPSALWSCTCKPIWWQNITCNCKLINKPSTKCNHTIIHNKCT